MKKIIDFALEYKATIALAIPMVTRACYALYNNGGIVGVLKGLFFGTNAPKKPKQEEPF